MRIKGVDWIVIEVENDTRLYEAVEDIIELAYAIA